MVQSFGDVAASDPRRAGSDTLVYTGSPSLACNAGLILLITLGELEVSVASTGALLCADGLTGATGITLFAPAEATSTLARRKLGFRSMEGNCIWLQACWPLR